MVSSIDANGDIFNPVPGSKENADLALALGDMMLAWQVAELGMVSSIGTLLKIRREKASKLFYTMPTFESRKKAIISLLEIESEYEEIKPHIEALGRMAKTRNKFVHQNFIQNFGGDKIYLISYRESVKSSRRGISIKVNDIHQHANYVRSRAINLEKTLYNIPAYRSWISSILDQALSALKHPSSSK